MNRSTTEIPKDMFKSLKTISLSLAALLLGAGSACGQQSDSYAHKVNTLIGTRGVGLTSGYLYPGATYPFGMVQFTPTYFAKRGGFVINQLSGGGCSHMGNFPTFPVTGKLDSSPNPESATRLPGSARNRLESCRPRCWRFPPAL